MNIMNRIWALGLMVMSMALTSCNDYFDTDPNNIINNDDYIAEEDEIYKGFLGILNRVQEAGDHAIFLTDTRTALLETTDNAPTELKAIYNYDETNGNSYADPTCYYAIIVACNDYINKMSEFQRNTGGMTEIAEGNFPRLLSSTLRTKAWAYLMLGKIYGEAYWFDDPLTEKKPLTDGSVFTHCNMKELADKAIYLLENGIDVNGKHIDANQTIEWYKWFNPETQTKDDTERKWEYLVPPAEILNAEFRSWRASYVSEDAAQSDWQWIHDHILQYIYNYHTLALEESEITHRIKGYTYVTETGIFQLTKQMQNDKDGAYANIFFTEDYGSKYQLLSTIMYDNENYQRNRIVQYFCPEYPSSDSYYLRPSDYGVSLYNEGDIRSLTQKWVMNTLGGNRCVSKYYYGYEFDTRTYEYLKGKDIFKIQPAIPTFRGHDLHFLLAEAETHLGHFTQAYAILNQGVSTEFVDNILPTDPALNWDSRYSTWLGVDGGYGNLGIAGAANGTIHELPRPTVEELAGYSEEQLNELKAQYDWAIADEHIKEYIAEGKSYSYLCKIAERYANSANRNGDQAKARDSFAARMTPKYSSTGRSGIVESRIKSNGYWINWDLKGIENSETQTEN